MSIGGGSEVLDENGQVIFTVKGKVFSWTKKKKIFDMSGALLYTVRNKFWHFLTNKVFVINAQGERVATIKKHRWSVSRNYELITPDNDMAIEGKIFSRTSSIMKGGEVLGTIVNDITIVNDAFTLEADEKDIAFCTAIVIAFDNMKDKLSDN